MQIKVIVVEDGGPMRRSDQLAYLEACRVYTDTNHWQGLFTYPRCGQDLFDAGLLATDGKITDAGRAALFLADYPHQDVRECGNCGGSVAECCMAGAGDTCADWRPMPSTSSAEEKP